MKNRKIVSAEIKPWRNQDPDIEYGIHCTLDDGMLVGMGIGSKQEAEVAVKDAVSKGEDFIREHFAANGYQWPD